MQAVARLPFRNRARPELAACPLHVERDSAPAAAAATAAATATVTETWVGAGLPRGACLTTALAGVLTRQPRGARTGLALVTSNINLGTAWRRGDGGGDLSGQNIHAVASHRVTGCPLNIGRQRCDVRRGGAQDDRRTQTSGPKYRSRAFLGNIGEGHCPPERLRRQSLGGVVD